MRSSLGPFLLTAACGWICWGAAAQTVEPIAQEDRYLPLPPPESVEEADALIARVGERMAGLAPASQPAAAATQPADVEKLDPRTRAAKKLWDANEAYLAALNRWKEDRQIVLRLGEAAALEELNTRIKEYETETTGVKAAMEGAPLWNPQAEIDRLKEIYGKLNPMHDARAAQQTERAARLAQLPARQNELTVQTTALAKELEDFRAKEAERLAAAKSDEERQAIDLDRRLLLVKLSLNRLQQSAAVVEQTRMTLERSREEKLLAALKEYVVTLRTRINSLEQGLAKSELERAEMQLGYARQPSEKLYWRARKVLLEASAYVRHFNNPTRDRYPESISQGNLSDWTRSESFWKEFVASLPRRQGPEIKRAYRQVYADLTEMRRSLADVQAKYDLTFDQKELVLAKQEEVQETVEGLRGEMQTVIASLTDEERRKNAQALQLELESKHIPDFNKTVSDMLREQEATQDRLRAGMAACEKMVATLDRLRSQLYWSYVLVRDVGPAVAPWGEIRREISALAAGRGAHAETLADLTSELVAHARQVDWYQWSSALVVIAGALAAGWWSRPQIRRWYEAQCDAIREQLADAGDKAVLLPVRVKLQSAGLVAQIAPGIGASLAAAVAVELLGLPRSSARLALTLIALLAASVLAFGLVAVLFQTSRARFRIITCSNVVATYYRRGLRWILVAALLTGVLPLLGNTQDVLPETTAYLWQVHRSVILAALLIFLWPKDTVLKVTGRESRVRAKMLAGSIRMAYPWVWVALLVVLVGRVFGYGALADYVLGALALTVGTVLVASAVVRFFRDAEMGYQRNLERRMVRARERAVTESSGPDPGPAAVVELQAAEEQAARAKVLVAIGITLLRWAVTVGAVVLVLRAWGITLVEVQSFLNFPLWNRSQPDKLVSIGRAAGAVLVVVIAVVVWRGFRAVLEARVYPQYPALDRGSRSAINRLSQYFLLLIGLLVGLELLHLDLTALSWLLGTFGIGLGLGLQPLFVNFISGLLIYFERHIRVGDVVEVDGKMGEVTQVSIRSTHIRTPDGIDLIIPNGEFINSQVVNWTLENAVVRGQIKVGVAYGSDLQLVRKLLLEVAAESPRALKEPEPGVWFTDFGDSSLDFALVAWFPSPADRWFGMIDMRYEIDRKFRENGIEIPFPQRTLSLIGDRPLPIHLVGGEERTAASVSMRPSRAGVPTKST